MDLKVVLCAILFVYSSSAIKINANGGYDLTVAIHHDVPEPGVGAVNYINNIKSNYQSLSMLMWKATNKTFWIKSVHVIVPPSWSIPEAVLDVGSYSKADVRVGAHEELPMVENPNLCGQPGNFIELPQTFHEVANSGDYGDNAKALLALWARYRWGAYEEHGYPGSKNFPYFTQVENAAENEPHWIPTGCTDAPKNRLNGSYVNLDGSACDVSSSTAPGSTCRFVPDVTGNSEATTSLMHFHWLESVQFFCDETNHVKDVPNKQNALCGGKSVMETIRSSPDYKTVTNKQEDSVKRPTFTYSKPYSKPALYILIDRGMHTDNDAAAWTVALVENVKQALQLVGVDGVVAGIGVYPGSASEPGLEEIMSVGALSGREDEFIEKISLRQVLPVQERDFGKAVILAAEKVQSFGAIRGGAVLVLKSGNLSSDSAFTYETDVERRLKSIGVSLYAIEVAQGEENTNQNLLRLATETAGIGVAVRAESGYDVVGQVQQLWAKLRPFVTGESGVQLNQLRVVLDASVKEATKALLPEGSEVVMIQLVSSEPLEQITTKTEDPNVGLGHSNFTQRMEYGGSEGARYVYEGELSVAEAENVKSVTVQFTGPEARLIITADGETITNDVEVVVYTSAQDDKVDLASVANANAPFSIFARVTYDGTPITGANVTATLEAGGKTTTIMLLDDGSEDSGDAVKDDGIYSQVIVPPQDGSYRIAVTVDKTTGEDRPRSQPETAGNTRLLPIKQDIPEEEEPAPAPGNFHKTEAYGGRVEVVNRMEYKAVIRPITDFKVTAEEGSYNVKFSFTAPKIVGVSDPVEQFRFYRSTSQQALEKVNLDAPSLPEGVTNAFSKDGVAPGNQVTVDQEVARDLFYYYAVAAFNGTSHSPLSKVVDVSKIDDDDEEWLKSTTGIITVTVVVVVCFIAAFVGYKVVQKRQAKKAAGTRFVRPGDLGA